MKLESIWWLMIAITWMEIKETFSTAAKNNEILKHKFLPRNIGGKSKKKGAIILKSTKIYLYLAA